MAPDDTASIEAQAIDAAIVAASWIIPFLLAFFPVWRWLVREYEIKRTDVQALFATTLATSTYSLLLVVYEILGVLEPTTRWLTWKVVLIAQVAMLLCVLPMAVVAILGEDLGLAPRTARLLAAAWEIVFFWAFWKAGSIFPIVRGGAHDLLSLEGFVGRLGVLGVATAAMISGYGAVSTPYNNLSVFLQHAKLEDISAKRAQVRQQLSRVLEKQRLLVEAELRLTQVRDANETQPEPAGASNDALRPATSAPSLAGQPASSGSVPDGRPKLGLIDSFSAHSPGRRAAVTAVHPSLSRAPSVGLSRAASGASGRHILGGVGWTPRLEHRAPKVLKPRPRASSDLALKPALGMLARVRDYASDYFAFMMTKDEALREAERDVENCAEDVRIQQHFLQALYSDLDALVGIYTREQWSRTPVGRAATLIGAGWSLICVLQLIVSIVGASINLWLRRSPTKDTVTVMIEWMLWALPIANAQLWVQPISFALVGILALTSVRGFLLNFSQAFSAWSTAATSNSTVLVLAQVMGAYLVATLLMLRMKVPPEYRRGITDAVGDVRFDFFHRWQDAIFVVSALASIIVFSMVSSTRSSRATEISLEERVVLEAAGQTRQQRSSSDSMLPTAHAGLRSPPEPKVAAPHQPAKALWAFAAAANAHNNKKMP